jgi:MoaA/NifB/PqqE/SkfB family radical SAM enzyme
MNQEVFTRAVDIFSALGVDDFRLTGGEPTGHPEFQSILKRLNEREIFPRLITNGIRLMQSRSPQSVLRRVSRCWISVYGISPQQHRFIGGAQGLPLEDILAFAGKQSQRGHWVGISAILADMSLTTLKGFVALARKHHVRFLRFLIAEPSGRALSSHLGLLHGADARDRAREIHEYLRSTAEEGLFDFLTLSNPFDLESRYPSGIASCLLWSRRLWAVSPEGDVYSCCFNIDDPMHRIANVLQERCIENISGVAMSGVHAARCKALDASFWETGSCVTCPISALSLTRSESTTPEAAFHGDRVYSLRGQRRSLV